MLSDSNERRSILRRRRIGRRTTPYNAILTPVEPDPRPRSGPLAGKTLVVKDLVDTAGIRTTYGSRIYGDHFPERTAPAAQRLIDAGATIVGKASLPEFAWSVTGQNPWYGTVRNPRHPGRTTGGSSSGNAAALAAGLCDLALGTDTGCLIRLPSACCGTVGLKPRWGAVSTDGVFPLVPSFDTVGPMARTVEEVAAAWSVLTGRPVPKPRLAGRTVGLLTRPPQLSDETPADNFAAESYVGELERLGAVVRPSRLPDAPADPCIPLTAFLRPVNMLGWSALAVGHLQLIAPHDETVLAAGLAWERR